LSFPGSSVVVDLAGSSIRFLVDVGGFTAKGSFGDVAEAECVVMIESVVLFGVVVDDDADDLTALVRRGDG
jgi:hypothetical protein